MNSKEKDQYYGVKPRNMVLTSEALPGSPAKKPYRGYCKKGKGEHLFELDEVKVYPHRSYLGNYSGPCYVVGLFHWKEYRCTGCGKKKMVREEMVFDEPILAEKLHY